MKHSKLVLLSLVSLGLISCHPSTPPESDTASGLKPIDTAETTRKDTTATATEKKDTEKETATAGKDTASEDIYSKTLWKKSIVDKMLLRLGGEILPYTNLGKGLTCDWVSSGYSKDACYLEILSKKYDASKIDGFKKTYQAAGWTIIEDSKNPNVMTASFKEKHLQVKIGPDSEEDLEYAGFRLQAFYDEPYDPSLKADWSEEERNNIESNLGGHDVPFFYMGAKNVDFNVRNKKLQIVGYAWNDAIWSAAQKAFKDAGWTVTLDSETGNSFTAEYIEPSDKCVMEASFSNRLSADSSLRTMLEVSQKEGYNPESFSGWSKADLTTMKDVLGGHTLPTIYLGTANPMLTEDQDKSQLKIEGGTFDPQMLTDVKAALEQDGWIVENKDGSYAGALFAKKECDDGSLLTLYLYTPYYSEKGGFSEVTVLVNYYPSVTLPTGDQANYDSDTQAVIDQSLNGHALPYLYLGDSDTDASYNSATSELRITPKANNSYNQQYLYNAEKVLTQAGYKVTLSEKSNDRSIYQLEAARTEDDGCQFKVSLTPPTPTALGKGKAILYVTYTEPYGAHKATSWSEGTAIGEENATTATSMATHLENHAVPFVYLGRKNFESSFDESTKTMTIKGGAWDNQILTDLKAAISADNDTTIGTWGEGSQVTDASSCITYTNTKNFVDKTSYLLTLKQSSTNASDPRTTLTIRYKDAYGATETAWPKSVTDVIDKNFSGKGYSIPYTYLHATNDELTVSRFNSSKTYSSYVGGAGILYNQYFTITGGSFDDRIISDAAASFKTAGWEVVDNEEKTNGHPVFTAIHENTDKSDFRILILANSRGNAEMGIYYDAPITDTLTGSYTAEETAEITKILGTGHTIPYLYHGDMKKVQANDTEATSTRYASLSIATDGRTKDANKKYHYLLNNYHYMKNIADVLESDGWDVNLSLFGSYRNHSSGTAQAKVYATKTNADDGSMMRLESKAARQDITTKIYSSPKYEKPATTPSYEGRAAEILKDNLNDAPIPYFYLGTTPDLVRVPTNSKSSNKVTLMGGFFQDNIYTDAIETMKKDTTITWTYMYSYAEEGKVLLATGEYQDSQGNTHHLTAKFFRNDDAPYDARVEFIYYE